MYDYRFYILIPINQEKLANRGMAKATRNFLDSLTFTTPIADLTDTILYYAASTVARETMRQLFEMDITGALWWRCDHDKRLLGTNHGPSERLIGRRFDFHAVLTALNLKIYLPDPEEE